jgi:hypothetical protein
MNRLNKDRMELRMKNCLVKKRYAFVYVCNASYIMNNKGKDSCQFSYIEKIRKNLSVCVCNASYTKR